MTNEMDSEAVHKTMPEYRYYAAMKKYDATHNLDDLADQELYENILRNEYKYSDDILQLLISVMERKENING